MKGVNYRVLALWYWQMKWSDTDISHLPCQIKATREKWLEWFQHCAELIWSWFKQESRQGEGHTLEFHRHLCRFSGDFKQIHIPLVKLRQLRRLHPLVHVCDVMSCVVLFALRSKFVVRFDNMSKIWFTADELRRHHESPHELRGIWWIIQYYSLLKTAAEKKNPYCASL